MTLTYVPGCWTLLAGRELTLFTDAGPDTAVVRECWRLVSCGAAVDDVLGAIVHEGLRAIGAFVLASQDRVLVRGDVALTRGGGAAEWQAAEWVPTPTWHETAFDVPAMRMAAPGAADDAPVLPLSHGIVLASVVIVGRDDVVADAAVAEPGGIEKAEAGAAEEVAGEAPVVVSPPARTPASVVPPRVERRQVLEVAPVGERNGESRQYDELFTPSVAPAAVPAGVEATVRLTPAPGMTPPLQAPPREQPPLRVPPPPPPAPTPAPTPAGFIDHLPWAPVGRAGEAPPPSVSQTEPGATLQRPPRATGRGVRVQAVRCPAGHPNPVTAESCRVCRAPVTDREATEVNRPRLGVLRLSTDPEPIALERGVVLGREPAGQADVDRIALRRPDISANHVEVRLAGWQVLAVDLGSRNGTLVIGPDGGTVELTPHVPVELCHGTEVVLSDEIRFRFEVTS